MHIAITLHKLVPSVSGESMETRETIVIRFTGKIDVWERLLKFVTDIGYEEIEV